MAAEKKSEKFKEKREVREDARTKRINPGGVTYRILKDASGKVVVQAASMVITPFVQEQGP